MKKLRNMTEPELKEKIIFHSGIIIKRQRSLLKHARQCGKVLLEVKGRMKHGEFQSWIEENIKEYSYKTLAVYMQVANNWDKPEIQDAIKTGAINSIDSFRQAIKSESDSDPKQPTKKLTPQQRQDYEVNVKYLCKTFKEYITGMEPAEIAKLAKWFDDKIWHRWEEIMDEELNKVSTENIKFPKPKLQKTAR